VGKVRRVSTLEDAAAAALSALRRETWTARPFSGDGAAIRGRIAEARATLERVRVFAAVDFWLRERGVFPRLPRPVVEGGDEAERTWECRLEVLPGPHGVIDASGHRRTGCSESGIIEISIPDSLRTSRAEKSLGDVNKRHLPW